MEARKWEDLSEELLANVFGRVGLEPLILDIHFVCKSWFKASLQPQLLKALYFSILDNKSQQSFAQKYTERYAIKNFSNTSFIKILARRVCISVRIIFLPSQWTLEILDYISTQCPALYLLSASINYLSLEEGDIFAELVGKFKNLQCLKLISSCNPIERILNQVNKNCPKLSGFAIQGTVTQQEASAIVSTIPTIKVLSFNSSNLDRDALMTIIDGCRELSILDLSNCRGVDINKEILEKVGHLKKFLYQNCRIVFSDKVIAYLSDMMNERMWARELAMVPEEARRRVINMDPGVFTWSAYPDGEAILADADEDAS